MRHGPPDWERCIYPTESRSTCRDMEDRGVYDHDASAKSPRSRRGGRAMPARQKSTPTITREDGQPHAEPAQLARRWIPVDVDDVPCAPADRISVQLELRQVRVDFVPVAGCSALSSTKSLEHQRVHVGRHEAAIACSGVQTIGSPRTLKLVLTMHRAAGLRLEALESDL